MAYNNNDKKGNNNILNTIKPTKDVNSCDEILKNLNFFEKDVKNMTNDIKELHKNSIIDNLTKMFDEVKLNTHDIKNNIENAVTVEKKNIVQTFVEKIKNNKGNKEKNILSK